MGPEPTQRPVRTAALALLAALLTVTPAFAAMTAVVSQAGPSVTVLLDPALPDGADGWYVTPPESWVRADQACDLGWGWDAIESTVTLVGGLQEYLSDAPEGRHDLVFKAVLGSGTSYGTVPLKVDSGLPSRPELLHRVALTQGVSLAWAPSSDAVSGLRLYRVYRNRTDGTMTDEDLIGTTALPAFVDTTSGGHDTIKPDPPERVTAWHDGYERLRITWSQGADPVFYAVSALDVAGNASQLTERLRVLTPPEGYLVERSSDGGPASVVATLPGAADSFDRRGPAASDGESYSLRAIDAAGLVSEPTTAAVRRIDRVAGRDRVATALAASRAAFPSARTVVVASAMDFPDALSASALAGAVRGPVLLVKRGPLPSATLAELRRLGATEAYVVGGAAAVERSTAVSLGTALAGKVIRLGGRDRYDTARLVAERIRRLRGTPPRAYVVSGVNFPDALSAGPAAYAEAAPVLYAKPDSIPSPTLSAIRSLGVKRTVVLGSERAVTGAAETRLPSPRRVAGRDRYETSTRFSNWAIAEGILGATRPVVATGAAFPDGLTAAPLAGGRASPVVLEAPDGGSFGALWLFTHGDGLEGVTLMGSEAALPKTVQTHIWTLLAGPAAGARHLQRAP
ncbi:MAG: cell wall-binding repeat-containing protein [Coriobacteriia bacterium]|nr:cell wall-binding repeat-containing protein [Coriobacteriia bacterium]